MSIQTPTKAGFGTSDWFGETHPIYTSMQDGWRCPVCGKGNSPIALKCQHCKDVPEGCKHEWEYSSDTSGDWNTCRKCGKKQRTYA